jgi:hypothetical protein
LGGTVLCTPYPQVRIEKCGELQPVDNPIAHVFADWFQSRNAAWQHCDGMVNAAIQF